MWVCKGLSVLKAQWVPKHFRRGWGSQDTGGITRWGTASGLSQNHGMAEVGRDLWRSSSPTPLPKQGHLERIAQDCVQMAFEYLQGWRLHKVCGQPVPLLGHPHSEKVFPHVQEEPPVFHFVPIASCPVTGHLWKEAGSVFLSPSLQIFMYTDKFPPEGSLLQAEQSLLSQPFSIEEMFLYLHHPCGPLFNSLQYVHISLLPGAQTSTQCSRCGLTSAEEKDHLLWPAGNRRLLLPSMLLLTLFGILRACSSLVFSQASNFLIWSPDHI